MFTFTPAKVSSSDSLNKTTTSGSTDTVTFSHTGSRLAGARPSGPSTTQRPSATGSGCTSPFTLSAVTSGSPFPAQPAGITESSGTPTPSIAASGDSSAFAKHPTGATRSSSTFSSGVATGNGSPFATQPARATGIQSNGSPSAAQPAGATGVPNPSTSASTTQPPGTTANSFTVSGRNVTTGSGSTFGQPLPHFSDLVKQRQMEEFTRRFLLGEELVNTRFHIFSSRSLLSGRITKPRVLCANNTLLAKSSKYFLDLLSLDVDPSDSSLTELTDDEDIPSSIPIEDYSYESDSDLDDDDPAPEVSEGQCKTAHAEDSAKKGEVEHKRNGDKGPQTVVEQTLGNEPSASHSKARRQSSGSRDIVVKDAAFQTWYTLLNYLSTGKVSFLPLSSAAPGRHLCSSNTTSPLDEPKCSAKSMYRLACKIKLDDLRDQALAHIRSNLKDHNILREISSNLLSSHTQLLNMELDVLYLYISTPLVVANFPSLIRRIANKELPHGAEIMTTLHSRFLKALHPFSSSFTLASSPPAQPLPFPISGTHSRPAVVHLPTTTLQGPGTRTGNESQGSGGSERPERQSLAEATTVRGANESEKK